MADNDPRQGDAADAGSDASDVSRADAALDATDPDPADPADTDWENDWVEPDPSEPAATGPPLQAIAMVEAAFLASTSGLIWLINTYFPPGPLLRILFPIPIALAYMRRGPRTGWMACAISWLLLTVLMGPTRSVLFLMPFGVMGVQLGACWRRKVSWVVSIPFAALLGTIGFFFRFWLLSLLIGEDLWTYGLAQAAEFLEWWFVRFGILAQPSLDAIRAIAVLLVVASSIIYQFAVHVVALLVLDRLGNSISRPPQWVLDIFDYE